MAGSSGDRRPSSLSQEDKARKFNAYLLVRELIVLVIVFVLAFMFLAVKKKEYLNYGYQNGWRFATKAYSYKLKDVDKEVLDLHYDEWRKKFRNQTLETYGIDVFMGWERAQYLSPINSELSN